MGDPANPPTTGPSAPSWRRIVAPLPGLQLQGSATFLKAELDGGVDSLADLKGVRLGNVAQAPGQPRGDLLPAERFRNLQLRADFHWVGSRFIEGPLTRPLVGEAAELPAYGYFNFGASLGSRAPGSGSMRTC